MFIIFACWLQKWPQKDTGFKPGTLFKSAAKKQPSCTQASSAYQKDVLWMLGSRGRAHDVNKDQPKTFTTPNEMKKPQGKFVPSPPGPGNKRGIKPLTLQEFLPGYTHSWHCLTIISPSAKKKIAQTIAEKALQTLGKTVAQAAEVNTSFDHDSYIQSLAERAAKGKDIMI